MIGSSVQYFFIFLHVVDALGYGPGYGCGSMKMYGKLYILSISNTRMHFTL